LDTTFASLVCGSLGRGRYLSVRIALRTLPCGLARQLSELGGKRARQRARIGNPAPALIGARERPTQHQWLQIDFVRTSESRRLLCAPKDVRSEHRSAAVPVESLPRERRSIPFLEGCQMGAHRGAKGFL